MSYSKKTIQLLSKAIDGDTTARKQLVEINQELAAFTDAVHGNKQAHHWLYDKGYYELSALLQTFNKDTEALQWLMKNKKEFAAIAGAIHNHKDSYLWLTNNGYYEYAELSDTIKSVL